MSSFSIKNTLDSPSWTVGSTNFANIPKSSLTYTRYGEQTLIYCNHPESIRETYLGDNGYYINKATVSTNEAQLYVSCNSLCNYQTKLVVRAYNPGSSAVTITKTNSGFNCTTNWSSQIETYQNFFQSISEQHVIPAKQSVWIEEETVNANGRFEALMRYSLTGTLQIAVYLCTNKNNVGSNTVAPPVSQTEYSGTAAAFYISTQNTLLSEDLFKSSYSSTLYGSSVFYGISNKEFSGNATEHNPITLVQGGIASEDSLTYNNLGNYGLQYAFTTTLKNNSNQNVKFRGYVISNPNSHCAGISSGGLAVGKFLGPNGEGSNGHTRWMFCETNAISPGNSVSLDYQYMHLSRGNTPGIIQWEAVKV